MYWQILTAVLQAHWQTVCADHDIACPSCSASIPYRYQQTHIAHHPETNTACPARQFGCPFNTKRKHLSSHAIMCSLAKLAPYLTAQQKRQDEQDQARQLLEKKLQSLQQDMENIGAHHNRRRERLLDAKNPRTFQTISQTLSCQTSRTSNHTHRQRSICSLCTKTCVKRSRVRQTPFTRLTPDSA